MELEYYDVNKHLSRKELKILDSQLLTYYFCGEADFCGDSDCEHGHCPNETIDHMREYLQGDYCVGCIASGFDISDCIARERLLINAYGENYTPPPEDFDD